MLIRMFAAAALAFLALSSVLAPGVSAQSRQNCSFCPNESSLAACVSCLQVNNCRATKPAFFCRRNNPSAFGAPGKGKGNVYSSRPRR